jgi:hypothetical protein
MLQILVPETRLFYKSLDLDKGCNILNFQFYFEKLILYPLYSYKIF